MPAFKNLQINVSQIVFEVFQFGIQPINRVSLSATVRLLHCDMEIMGSSRRNRVSACRGKAAYICHSVLKIALGGRLGGA